MSFLLVGLNHNTAPLALREKVAFTPDTMMKALSDFASQHSDDEAVILSTCNRTEIYVASEQGLSEQLAHWLSEFHGIDFDKLQAHLYQHTQLDSVKHLMKVASGLDSLVLGEPQIFGQVKQAFTEAKRAGTVGPRFEKLFQNAFAVAKHIRSQTEIGANAVSVAFAAVQLSKQIFSKLDKCNVLLVGAGETIELVGKHLLENKAQSITVANRTLENATQLSQKLNGDAISISQIPSHLAASDIVISSTASALPLIGVGMVSTALKARKHRPILFIDLAVPRDIEAEVGELSDAYLYTVDDLQEIVQLNLANREQAAAEALQIVEQKSLEFAQALQANEYIDLIKDYRESALVMSEQAVQRAMASLSQGAQPNVVIEELAQKLSKQLMHGPTIALQSAIKNGDQKLMNVLKSALINKDSNS